MFGWEGHFIIIWPLMNTDERGYFDSLTERVLGAAFEVSNSRGAGFLEKVYQRALLNRTPPSQHPGNGQAQEEPASTDPPSDIFRSSTKVSRPTVSFGGLYRSRNPAKLPKLAKISPERYSVRREKAL